MNSHASNRRETELSHGPDKEEGPHPSRAVTPARGSAGSEQLDLAAIRRDLANAQGRRYWRSLEELAGTPQFRRAVEREFAVGATDWPEDLSRRGFLKMAAACMALAGLTACTRQPTREIFPYVTQPEQLVLGEPLFYATSMVLGGFATGALAKNREGHPIKVDGNPDHPSSLGGSSIWLQSAILDLYDPDRSQSVLHNGELSTWGLLLDDLNTVVSEEQGRNGLGLRFLTETVTSPTLGAQLKDLLRRFPQAKWHQYEPVSRDHVREGARLAFGDLVEAQYRLEAASVIVSLDSDFLSIHPERLRYTRQFTDGRRISTGKGEMNRLYVAECSPTITGSMAEHRLPVGSSKIEGVALALCQKLGLSLGQAVVPQLPDAAIQWIDLLARDLSEHRGASVVIAGESQPAVVHALAHALNEHLENVGKTVVYTESAEVAPIEQVRSFAELAQDMQAGRVETLFILRGNPAYTAPSDLRFPELLGKVKRSIHLGLELDETAALSTWHVPVAHFLECWGDARSFDGTISLLQPLIQPLYGGKTAYELLGALFRQQPVLSDYELVRNYWQSQNRWTDFESGWRQALHNGFIADSALPPKQARVQDLNKILTTNPEPIATLEDQASPGQGVRRERPTGAVGLEFEPDIPRAQKPTGPLESDVELCFRPDSSVWDGRFANNGWLQECPRPISKLTWDNAALISPTLAQRCRLAQNDVIELRAQGRRLRLPVWILPGQADKTITVHLGYGRGRVGRVGTGVGVNVYPMRTTGALWSVQGVELFKTKSRHSLVSTQRHHAVESPDRQVLRECELRQLLEDPDVIRREVDQPKRQETLYDNSEYPYEGYKWAMSIDLTTCVGCNACLVACEAENNIPFVGKDQVARNREMFWIRVDTYYKDSLENPGFTHVPLPCMHCEHAPCELVCPVEATVHDHEGLNLQVYNRCVGTRFCSNNCPYKVRRFNFLQYTTYNDPASRPRYNPEVTVRWRGVMEKCTYCVQRIAAGRITAEKENRKIRDGEVRTACQQACPANAIVFGDLNTPNSKVSALKSQPTDYSMLGQLNTRPRTTYLARVQNPRRS